MDQSQLTLLQTPQVRRRGRPPGARNKRSADLARWIEATFAGMTPGQQSAELAMVKPADLKKAKALARELGLIDIDLPPLMLAMAVKARQLAKALGCEPIAAWGMLAKERADLMAYVHQRQAPAADSKTKAPATVFLIPEGEAQVQELPGVDFTEDFQVLDTQVAPPKSHDEAQPLTP